MILRYVGTVVQYTAPEEDDQNKNFIVHPGDICILLGTKHLVSFLILPKGDIRYISYDIKFHWTELS